MPTKSNILVVDDELSVRESFRMILKDNYNVLTASNGQEGLEMIKEKNPALVILDVRMPDINGIEVLKQIKDRQPQLPVMILTGAGTHRIAAEAIKLGAVDFIVKPINVEYVKQIIENALAGQEKKYAGSSLSSLEERIRNDYLDTLKALSKAIESRDPYTKRHSEMVAKYAVEIAQELGLSAEEIEVMEQAALLHDIGKIGIEDAILHKQSKLNPQEWEAVKRHPVIGEELIQPFKLLHIEQTMIRHHHERFDGAGYPDKLKGEEIPIYARILAVADSFEAMISDRPYRARLSLQETKNELEKGKGTQFDPKIVEAFLRVLEKNYPGGKMDNEMEMSKEKKRILLIDDEESIYMSIKNVFDKEYYLYFVKDGIQGCEKAELLKPDLIILDSRMPGMSGEETLLAIRKKDNKVPIVFLTAYPEDVISQIGNVGNASCFMAKPFDVSRLKELVENLTKKPSE